MRRLSLALILGATLLALPAHAQSNEADHEELRVLLKTATEALNAKDFGALEPLCTSGFTVTTVDNQKFTGLEAFKAHYLGLFEGPEASLRSATMQPEADALTEFLSDTVGVCHGSSKDSYTFRDGDVRVMSTRWTAVVVREDETWKLSRLHFSANLLDNPMLAAMKSLYLMSVAGAGGAGLALGLLVMGLLKRGKSGPA